MTDFEKIFSISETLFILHFYQCPSSLSNMLCHYFILCFYKFNQFNVMTYNSSIYSIADDLLINFNTIHFDHTFPIFKLLPDPLHLPTEPISFSPCEKKNKT